jgi:hypothetical protein
MYQGIGYFNAVEIALATLEGALGEHKEVFAEPYPRDISAVKNVNDRIGAARVVLDALLISGGFWPEDKLEYFVDGSVAGMLPVGNDAVADFARIAIDKRQHVSRGALMVYSRQTAEN